MKRPGPLFTGFLVGVEAIALGTSLLPRPIDFCYAGVIVLIGVLAWFGQRHVACLLGVPAALSLGTTAAIIKFASGGHRHMHEGSELTDGFLIFLFCASIIIASVWLYLSAEHEPRERIPSARTRRD